MFIEHLALFASVFLEMVQEVVFLFLYCCFQHQPVSSWKEAHNMLVIMSITSSVAISEPVRRKDSPIQASDQDPVQGFFFLLMVMQH